ncbi:hypothetical protein ACVOMT_20195 (plasmid) [Sphingomonas panni]|uniref:hypothetical protein n=1 Tax=Sphingomonas panni TaxID=237612 RepID=UPI003703F925
MITLLLLAMPMDAAATSAKPCIPIASDRLKPTSSELDAHRALRAAVGEPMPEAPTRVMLYGRGGHLSTEEYSIVVARDADGIWRGTAVGRTQMWIDGAPYEPLPRKAWVVDRNTGRQLDAALARRCRFDRSAIVADKSSPSARQDVGNDRRRADRPTDDQLRGERGGWRYRIADPAAAVGRSDNRPDVASPAPGQGDGGLGEGHPSPPPPPWYATAQDRLPCGRLIVKPTPYFRMMAARTAAKRER